jgi:GMP synthase (glutamine-hydrolysing)
MLLIIDNTIEGIGSSPREIRSALERLEPGARIVTERFENISSEHVKTLSPSHIFLSGQSHPWDKYRPESLAGVFHLIQNSPLPILGVCGGQQQIALAYRAPVGLMQRIAPGEGYDGALRERGYCSVNLAGQNGARENIFRGLPETITVWESHCDEVKEVPQDFVCTASNDVSKIQAMQHSSRPLFGVQFHPELFDEEHPHGRTILENFLNL